MKDEIVRDAARYIAMVVRNERSRMKSSAVFSDSRIYRYALWRMWGQGNGYVMFIGLNPSTADETNDDPTIRRCMGFAKLWDCGGICMMNLFAYRATNPKLLKNMGVEPVGCETNRYLKMYARSARLVVACWGNAGTLGNRASHVCDLIPHLHCLGLTKRGNPRHPLYVCGNVTPMHWGDLILRPTPETTG